MEYPFNNFFGQVGEDDKLVRDGQVLYAENLDLTSNSDFVTISPLPSQFSITPVKTDVMYFLEKNINMLIHTDYNKNIYLDGQNVYTASQKIKIFWSNSKYLFWLDDVFDIYRIPLTSVMSSWVGGVTMTDNTLEVDEGLAFVVEGEDSAILAYGTHLYEIETSSGAITNQFFFLFDKVAGLLESRDILEIAQQNGIVLSWDRVSDSASSYKLGIKTLKILQSANEKYIIGEGSYYIMSGGSLNKVAGQYNSDVLKQNKFKFGDIKNVGFMKQVSYVASSAINSITGGVSTFGDASVVILGNQKSGFQPGVSKFINTSSDGSKYAEIYGVVANSVNATGELNYLYIAYKNKNNTYGVDRVNMSTQNYTTSKEGLLILPVFDGGNKNIEKKLTKIKLRVDFGVTPTQSTPAGKFYVYKVENGVLTPFNGDITKSTIQYTAGKGFKELIIGENFFDVVIAILFKQDNNRTKNESLKLYSVIPDYEPIGR